MGAMDSPKPKTGAPFHLREILPETQARYEREREKLMQLHRLQEEIERLKESKREQPR